MTNTNNHHLISYFFLLSISAAPSLEEIWSKFNLCQPSKEPLTTSRVSLWVLCSRKPAMLCSKSGTGDPQNKSRSLKRRFKLLSSKMTGSGPVSPYERMDNDGAKKKKSNKKAKVEENMDKENNNLKEVKANKKKRVSLFSFVKYDLFCLLVDLLLRRSFVKVCWHLGPKVLLVGQIALNVKWCVEDNRIF